MHIAAQCGHPETALAFLKKGVPLHMPNKSGTLNVQYLNQIDQCCDIMSYTLSHRDRSPDLQLKRMGVQCRVVTIYNHN